MRLGETGFRVVVSLGDSLGEFRVRESLEDLGGGEAVAVRDGVHFIERVLGDGVCADGKGSEMQAPPARTGNGLERGDSEGSPVEVAFVRAVVEIGCAELVGKDLGGAVVVGLRGWVVFHFRRGAEDEPARSHGRDAGGLAGGKGAVGALRGAVEGGGQHRPVRGGGAVAVGVLDRCAAGVAYLCQFFP